ncbi:hypothetical protein TRVL_06289 [Trypanosoma vivax]|nr:hypothetical protein TRVL_06289 [Trypanosoma vivax]
MEGVWRWFFRTPSSRGGDAIQPRGRPFAENGGAFAKRELLRALGVSAAGLRGAIFCTTSFSGRKGTRRCALWLRFLDGSGRSMFEGRVLPAKGKGAEREAWPRRFERAPRFSLDAERRERLGIRGGGLRSLSRRFPKRATGLRSEFLAAGCEALSLRKAGAKGARDFRFYSEAKVAGRRSDSAPSASGLPNEGDPFLPSSPRANGPPSVGRSGAHFARRASYRGRRRLFSVAAGRLAQTSKNPFFPIARKEKAKRATREGPKGKQ